VRFARSFTYAMCGVCAREGGGEGERVGERESARERESTRARERERENERERARETELGKHMSQTHTQIHVICAVRVCVYVRV